MLGGKQFLGVMLLFLCSIGSSSAQPVELSQNSTVLLKKSTVSFENSTVSFENSIASLERGVERAMYCVTKNYRKTCRDNTSGKLAYAVWTDVTNHLEKKLPSSGSTSSYTYCSKNKTCVTMKTLSGSQFTPKKYQSSANNAISEMRGTQCGSLWYFYPTAIDVYLYEENFVISWYSTNVPNVLYRCDGSKYP
ncbi:hypothetical protein HPULCUR_001965 [Helicostylum pulchrum]|uniref:Uncharacterized protein n=1 Tax=Helicostylum pulchrum TaxID=562976 RepID=A0ABP9XPA2_9FUNG